MKLLVVHFGGPVRFGILHVGTRQALLRACLNLEMVGSTVGCDGTEQSQSCKNAIWAPSFSFLCRRSGRNHDPKMKKSNSCVKKTHQNILYGSVVSNLHLVGKKRNQSKQIV
eukprot:4131565-Amphidinium_carterae.1